MIDVTFQRIDQIRTSSDHDTDKLLITKKHTEARIIFSCAVWIFLSLKTSYYCNALLIIYIETAHYK